MELKEKIEEILNQARDEYWGTSEVTYEKVVKELLVLIQEQRADVVKSFAIWFEASLKLIQAVYTEVKWKQSGKNI